MLNKILVTGYDGFIGTNLIQKLSPKYEIIGLSNSRKQKTGFKTIKKNILHLKSSDIGNIDYIIHLAAITNPQICSKFPEKCIKTNVLGTQNLLEIAKQKKAKFVFASSSHIYGIPKKLPIREDHAKHPFSIYGGSKLSAEVLCESYAKEFDLDLTIIRIFSVYGPLSSSHYVLSNIVSKLQKEEKIILGSTRSKRDFIYISDVVNAFEIILKNTKGFDIFNVGSGKSYSIMEICKILEHISGKKLFLDSSKNLRKNDPNNIISENSKIKKLGWKPKIPIKQGLENMLKQHSI